MIVRNLTVTFDTNVWPNSKRKGFFFPKSLAVAFGKKRDEGLSLDLKIAKTSEPSRTIFGGSALLVSETEITTPRIFLKLDAGDEIRVTARNPQPHSRKSK